MAKFGDDDYAVTQRETLYRGFFKMEQYQLDYRRFDGGWQRNVTREIFERGDAAAALLFDPELDEFVMVEQFRPGAIGGQESPWLLELIAGMIEPGETAEEVVRRESIEESGCPLHGMKFICKYWVSPGGTTEQIHLYCARVRATEALEHAGLASENEDIRVHRIKREELFEMYRAQRLSNGMTLIAVQWFMLNQEQIAADWSA